MPFVKEKIHILSNKQQLRHSNIELLRIVSMFFIVLEHLLIMGTDFFSNSTGNQLYIANIIIGFTYIGVNCFILITGYFGSTFTRKRLLNLYLICCFYELIGFLIAYYHGDVEWCTTALGYILFPLSRSNTWFIRCYVILLFLLPIINAGLEKITKKQFAYILFLLTMLNLYFGWFQKHENYNSIGYDSSQMIYLYVIGRYLNRFVDWSRIRHYRGYLLIGWVLLSFSWGILQNINDWRVIPHWNGWAYNNPVVLLSTIVFFAYFQCVDIRNSKLINAFSMSMLGVFLLHMNRYIGTYLYNWIKNIILLPQIDEHLGWQILILIAVALCFLILSALFDMPRAIITNWILNRINQISGKFKCKNTTVH